VFPLLERDYVGYNVDMVALFALGSRPAPAERFDSYRRALGRLQSRPFPSGPESSRHLLRFDVEDPVVRECLEVLFDGRGAVEGSGVSSDEDVREISRLVREAEDLLETYSASAASVLRLLIGSMLFARLPV
jgi:hypothetical protein